MFSRKGNAMPDDPNFVPSFSAPNLSDEDVEDVNMEADFDKEFEA